MNRTGFQRNQDAATRMGGFHRRYNRGSVSGFSCDIADRHRLFRGKIEDISTNGFKMTQISDSFIGDEHCYQTVVAGNNKHFKVLAKPCWRKRTDSGLEIGFKILDVSWEWTEYVLTILPVHGRSQSPRGNA